MVSDEAMRSDTLAELAGFAALAAAVTLLLSTIALALFFALTGSLVALGLDLLSARRSEAAPR